MPVKGPKKGTEYYRSPAMVKQMEDRFMDGPFRRDPDIEAELKRQGKSKSPGRKSQGRGCERKAKTYHLAGCFMIQLFPKGLRITTDPNEVTCFYCKRKLSGDEV